MLVLSSLLEQHFRQGNYVAAQLEFERLLVDLPGEDLLNLAWTHFWGAKLKAAQRENYAAIQLFSLALEFATKVPEWVLIGRVRLDCAACYRQIGDTHMALEYASAFLTDLPSYPALAQYEGAAHYNLGLIYRCRRDMEASEHHYATAVTLLRNSPNQRWLLMALQNLAWILYEQDKFAAGDRSLDEASLLIESLDDRSAQLTQHYFRAFGALQRGDTQTATAFCLEVLAPESNATDEQRTWATWLVAEASLQLGHIDEAHALIEAAMDWCAHSVKDIRVLNYISATRRKILSLRRSSPDGPPN